MNEQAVVVFVQDFGSSRAVDATPTDSVRGVLQRLGSVGDTPCFVGELSQGDELDDDLSAKEVALDSVIAQHVREGRVYLHRHRCRQIEVTVNYLSKQARRKFPPNIRVSQVLTWAKRKLGLVDQDADKLLLQVCGTDRRPRPSQFLAEIASDCQLCFDLVPDVKVEG